jgi:SAM-dependent methyltransferase
MSVEHEAYFAYLRGRSRLAWAYRRLYLYPRLIRYLHGRVLDVGCGIGDLLAFLPGAVGAEVNPEAVAWCRARGLDVRQSQPGALPFSAAAFDSVMLDNVLEHVAEPGALLEEIRRVLAPDGTLIVGVPGERGFASDPDHKIHYDEAALRSALEAAGFRTTRVLHVPWRARWLSRVLPQYCVYGVFRRTA